MTNWSNPEYGIVYLDTDNAVVEVEFTDSLDDQAACWVVGDRAAAYPTAIAAELYEISEKPWFLVGRLTAAEQWQYRHLLLRVNPFEPEGGWDDDAVEVMERLREPAGTAQAVDFFGQILKRESRFLTVKPGRNKNVPSGVGGPL